MECYGNLVELITLENVKEPNNTMTITALLIF